MKQFTLGSANCLLITAVQECSNVCKRCEENEYNLKIKKSQKYISFKEEFKFLYSLNWIRNTADAKVKLFSYMKLH